jgi:hypothetical protein
LHINISHINTSHINTSHINISHISRIRFFEWFSCQGTFSPLFSDRYERSRQKITPFLKRFRLVEVNLNEHRKESINYQNWKLYSYYIVS